MPLVTSDMNLGAALRKAKIVPTMIKEDFQPSVMLDIKYPKSGQDVALGNTIKPSEASEAPNVTIVPADEDTYYTLMMVDPDAPSATDNKFSPWRHWVVVNIPGSEASVNATSQRQVSPYYGPAPPRGTGPHRYIFLLYKQATKDQVFTALNNDDRRWFNYEEYARSHNLQLVGINFFYSEA